MSEDASQLPKRSGEYGIMTSNVSLLQEAVDLVNRRLVTVAYGMGEVTVVDRNCAADCRNAKVVQADSGGR